MASSFWFPTNRRTEGGWETEEGFPGGFSKCFVTYSRCFGICEERLRKLAGWGCVFVQQKKKVLED